MIERCGHCGKIYCWGDCFATQGIEARQGGNGGAGAVHESPVGAADAPEPQSDTPS